MAQHITSTLRDNLHSLLVRQRVDSVNLKITHMIFIIIIIIIWFQSTQFYSIFTQTTVKQQRSFAHTVLNFDMSHLFLPPTVSARVISSQNSAFFCPTLYSRCLPLSAPTVERGSWRNSSERWSSSPWRQWKTYGCGRWRIFAKTALSQSISIVSRIATARLSTDDDQGIKAATSRSAAHRLTCQAEAPSQPPPLRFLVIPLPFPHSALQCYTAAATAWRMTAAYKARDRPAESD